jgi:hypothetical protein
MIRRVVCGVLMCVVLTLAMIGLAQPTVSVGRPLYVLADANCAQVDQDPNYVPFLYDPNKIVGHLIGAVECYHKLPLVLPGQWCDPDGDPVVVTLSAAPSWLSMTVDQETRSFLLVGEPPKMGLTYVVLTLADIPPDGSPAVIQATILLNTLPRPNSPPTVRLNLESLDVQP